MYSDNYEETDNEESTSSGGIGGFYNNNKKLVWVLIGLVIFIVLALILTKGGSNSNNGTTDTTTKIAYKSDEMAAVSMQVNSSNTLEVTINNKSKNGKVVWESSNKDVVEVGKDNDGKVLVTSKNTLGTAIVKASYMVGDKLVDSIDFSITVYEGDESVKLQTILFPDQDLMLNKVISSYDLGDKLTYFPAEGYITNKEFISSDSNVVVVDGDGKVTPVGLGSATITAKINDLEAKINVYVLENVISPGLLKNPEEIKFSSSLVSIKKDEIITLQPELTPSSASPEYLTWASDNSSVVKVENDGTISGLSVGSATITVRSISGSEGKVLVEVLENVIKVESIAFSPSSLSLEVGEAYTLTPVISPSDATNKGLSYSSNNPTVASCVSTEGGVSVTVNAHAKGTAIITATSVDGVTRDITVTVTKSSGSSGTPGSSTSNPYDNKGYKISSTGGNVSRSYEATINNPLKDGVTSQVITFTITSSSTKKLKVCTYQYNGTECNVNNGIVITSSRQITLSTKGTWVIKVVEVDGDDKELKDPLYWYTLVDKGSSTTSSTQTGPCSIGYWRGQYGCEQCPAGHKCNGTSKEACTGSTYQDKAGQSTCAICLPPKKVNSNHTKCETSTGNDTSEQQQNNNDSTPFSVSPTSVSMNCTETKSITLSGLNGSNQNSVTCSVEDGSGFGQFATDTSNVIINKSNFVLSSANKQQVINITANRWGTGSITCKPSSGSEVKVNVKINKVNLKKDGSSSIELKRGETTTLTLTSDENIDTSYFNSYKYHHFADENCLSATSSVSGKKITVKLTSKNDNSCSSTRFGIGINGRNGNCSNGMELYYVYIVD